VGSPSSYQRTAASSPGPACETRLRRRDRARLVLRPSHRRRSRSPAPSSLGRSICSSNSGTGTKFPRRPVDCFQWLPGAEICRPSPNCPNGHFRHRLPSLLAELMRASSTGWRIQAQVRRSGSEVLAARNWVRFVRAIGFVPPCGIGAFRKCGAHDLFSISCKGSVAPRR